MSPGVVTAALQPDRDRAQLEAVWARPRGIVGWLTTTNHKDIASRYIVTALVFFALAGALAVLIRLQLARPENRLLGPDLYNQVFTTHGTAMMFLFAVPIMQGIALWVIPPMVGTRNVAFPRLNAFGYYVYLAAGLLLFGGLLLNTGADMGWFAYPPLSGPEFSPGKRVDVWSQTITLAEIASLVAAVQVLATVFKMRAPGMALHRLPVFVWASVVTAVMVLLAMPAVMVVSSMLAADRLTNVATHFFNAAEGGDVLLYQHLFWFFGHPEVYIIFIPATGFISVLVENFSRRRIVGYNAVVASLIATGAIGFGLWVHHMFNTHVSLLGARVFSAASMLIAIPSGIQVFCWIATLWTGRPRLVAPLLYALGFVALFVLGGITGVMLASLAIDQQVHDTYFVVAHFHYVLIGGAVFPLLGAITYWFPKWTGRLMSERLGQVTFWVMFAGFNLTFFPMHQLGLMGMPRRVYTYTADSGWGGLNLLATIGGVVLTAGVLLFVFNLARSLRRGRRAGPNPWGSGTLEWATASPPPRYNFQYLPTVSSRYPLWDKPDDPVVVGLATDHRSKLVTSVRDAIPQHKAEVAGDTLMPFLLALATAATFIGVMFHPAAIPLGAALATAVLMRWFWEQTAWPPAPDDAHSAPPQAPPSEKALEGA